MQRKCHVVLENETLPFVVLSLNTKELSYICELVKKSVRSCRWPFSKKVTCKKEEGIFYKNK